MPESHITRCSVRIYAPALGTPEQPERQRGLFLCNQPMPCPVHHEPSSSARDGEAAYDVGSETQPAHLRGRDVFAVVSDEGQSHCVHRVRSNAEACAAWFGAEVQEWLLHD